MASAVVGSLARVIVVCLAAGQSGGADEYWPQRDALDAKFAADLAALAVRCEELKLPEPAEVTRTWFVSRDKRRQYLFLPAEADATKPAADAPRVVQQWHAKFSSLRSQRADALFQLARQELDADRPTRTYQLLHEVLHENPDHAVARQVLGYRTVNGRWRKPEGTIRTRLVSTANPELGFAAGRHWVVESQNFRITTDHSEQAGERLAERLEMLSDLWQQLFFAYWSDAATLARRFAAGAPPARSLNRHAVVLFRDRQGYVEQLKRVEPLIEVSVGIYLEGRRTAYFYVADEPNDGTCFHEVTHQLFSETGRVGPGAGLEANMWIIEGVAMYMESLQPVGTGFTVGGVDAKRLQFARYRALNDGFYLPLTQLAALGRRALQEHPDIQPLYSQSAGLAAFLMDHERGVHQPLLAEYLRTVYQGRATARVLADLAGKPVAEFDQAYRQFLNVTDDDLAALAAIPTAKNLCLGHTHVSDAGLEHLSGHTGLEWLDLASTNVTDAGVRELRPLLRLKQLSLKHTRITDEALATVGGFRELETLDLSATGITDAGLAHVRSLSRLQELGLGATPITDAGLEHLRGLQHLETLDVGGTRVTIEGFRRLKQAVPSLQTEVTAQP